MLQAAPFSEHELEIRETQAKHSKDPSANLIQLEHLCIHEISLSEELIQIVHVAHPLANASVLTNTRIFAGPRADGM